MPARFVAAARACSSKLAESSTAREELLPRGTARRFIGLGGTPAAELRSHGPLTPPVGALHSEHEF